MSGLLVLAAICAVLWLVSFAMLYRGATRQQDLQHQVDAFERALHQKQG